MRKALALQTLQTLLTLLSLLPLASVPARAADGPDAGPPAPRAGATDPLAAVAPFLDAQTLAVARIDLTRIDLKAAQAWADRVLKGAKDDPSADAGLGRVLSRQMADGLPAAQAWLDSFTKAGVRDVYVVIDPAEAIGAPTYVVPLADGADARAIERRFNPPEPQPDAPHSYGKPVGDPSEEARAEQIGRAVVVAPPAVLERLRGAKPVDRPDPSKPSELSDLSNLSNLSDALAAAGDAPLAAALALPADARRVVEELLPNLPAELGGGKSAEVTRGLKWVSVAVRLPPEPALALVVRASDADAAKALARVASAAGKWASAQKGEDAATERLGTLLAALTPQPSADHPEELATKLDGPALRRLAGEFLSSYQGSRLRAMAVKSSNNMKQVLLGCIMYANGKKGEWPEKLEALLKDQDISPDVLVNPARPDARVGYTYLNPGRQSDIKDAARLPVLYETDAGPNGRNVGFADGHVDLLDEAHFQEALKAAKERKK